MKEFKPSLAVACDVLKEPYDTPKEDTKTKPTAALLNANRVTDAKKGKDLMNKVPYVCIICSFHYSSKLYISQDVFYFSPMYRQEFAKVGWQLGIIEVIVSTYN